MGHEQSQMSGLIVEEKAVEVTDFWSHHSATLNAGNTTVSVFIGEPLVGGSLWVSQTPLEKASKNLMLHRHPCILRYVSSWSKGSKYYLAVENVKPLSHMLHTQSMLQICIGLHSILKGLVFLHETAQASHNNLCTASIYVTKDGGWKLGGFEYLCKFQDISIEYMSKSRAHRYDKAIDPNEDKHLGSERKRLDFIDVFAFGVLVNEVFKNEKTNTDDSVPLHQFLELCKHDLQHLEIQKRPTLSSLLQDGFFNHDFIAIHSFLVELPLKSDQEKDSFFVSLIQRLHSFNQVIVAKQLAGLLLSRMVLLNKTAQTSVIPQLLTLKENQSDALFNTATFREFVVPKLLEIFCVRDAQIRLLLLEYFSHFLTCFTKEQLQNNVLPELLLGIKDTNDHLVSVTLRSLADLIPILGSAIVIGGKRAKLFNDGLPNLHKPSTSSTRRTTHSLDLVTRLPSSIRNDSDVLSLSNSSGSGTETQVDLILNERPSPDGEEGDTSTITDEGGDDNQNGAESPSNEDWDDWEINDTTEANDPLRDGVSAAATITTTTGNSEVQLDGSSNCNFDNRNSELQVSSNSNNNRKSEQLLPDILDLDIKNIKNNNENGKSDDFDFFQDMEPVINTSTKFLIGNDDALEFSNAYNKKKMNDDVDVKEIASKFDWSVSIRTEQPEEGWGDDLDGWE